MRTIERSTAFKRDYRREAKAYQRAALDTGFMPMLLALASDQPLEPRTAITS
jgi:mRNA interferase YafQ